MKHFDIKLIWKKARHAFKDIGSDADKDWKIVLVTAIILFLLIAAYNAEVFLALRSGQRTSAADNAVPTELINAKALENVLVKYDKRREAFNATAAQTFSFVDPAR
jgi:hypothetical protein